MRRFVSRFPICDTVKIHRSAAKGVRESGGFYSASVSFHCITNRKPGGESTHNFASLSYTSLCGLINYQILNRPGSFDGVFAKCISVLALDYPPGSTTPRVQYRWYLLRCGQKRGKYRYFSPVLHSAIMSNGPIKNRRWGGESRVPAT